MLIEIRCRCVNTGSAPNTEKKVGVSVWLKIWIAKDEQEIYCIGIFEKQSYNEEESFIELLLHHISGPKSLKDLRTINNVIYGTFKEAAEVMNLFNI